MLPNLTPLASSFFVGFPSDLSDNTFQPTAILIKHLILIILPLLLQTCAVGVGHTPKQVRCSRIPAGGHAGLADPSFSPPPLLSVFSRSEQQHHQLICFLLSPMPLLMSPPPLLSADLFPLRATFFLLVIFHSLLCLPLLNISALASQEQKSHLLASKPITFLSAISTSLVQPSYFGPCSLHSEIFLTFFWVYTSFST